MPPIARPLACALIVLLTAQGSEAAMPGKPAQTPVPGRTRAPEIQSTASIRVHEVATGLNHPWGLQVLPDGRLIVTERFDGIRVVTADGQVSPPLGGVPVAFMEDQGGLFDIVLAPDFAESRVVFLSYFEPREKGAGLAVARARLAPVDGKGGHLEDVRVIFRAEPVTGPAKNIGGRMALARDGTLFVSVGDRFTARDQAQDLGSHLGKIVRIRTDGSVPEDNPFVGRAGARPEIWSYGHRNPQGLAIHPRTGALWAQEHGARGGDEINIIEPGKNYGWPVISYGRHYSGLKIGEGTEKPGLEQPVYYWDPSIAPSGLAFYSGKLFPAWKGSLFNGALVWRRLIRLALEDGKVVGEEELLAERRARIRHVHEGPDGALYVLTDEARGAILKLTP